MLEVEGGSDKECMRIMRHETAHALDNAYRIRRRKEWRRTFGKASVQSIRPLANGGALKLTTAKYVTPGDTRLGEAVTGIGAPS